VLEREDIEVIATMVELLVPDEEDPPPWPGYVEE
jgi:hypothetical protein